MRGVIPSVFGENVRWWIGVVEDRADPQQRGRVRARIFGYHTSDKSLIPTEALPWAIPIQSVTSAAIGGVGESPTGVMEGSWILGSFLDGNDMQVPIYFGTIALIEGVVSSGRAGQSTNGDGLINSSGVEDVNNGTTGNVKYEGSGPPWLQVARGEIGQKEFKGGMDNPRIVEYHKTVGKNAGDTTAWCSAFAAWCVKNSGQSIAGVTAMARSWTQASCVEKIDKPLHGCIAVFSRPPNPQSGHVGFVDAIQGGNVILVSGNTSDAVTRSGFPMSRLLGWYWPRGYDKSAYQIPSA